MHANVLTMYPPTVILKWQWQTVFVGHGDVDRHPVLNVHNDKEKRKENTEITFATGLVVADGAWIYTESFFVILAAHCEDAQARRTCERIMARKLA